MNGSPAMMVIACNPFSASSPPATSMIAATAPVATPQKTTTGRRGSIVPFSLRVPITTEAASAPETKKIATSTMTSTEVIVAHGIVSKQGEQGAFRGLHLAQVGAALLGVDRRAPEDRKPDEADEARQQQNAGDELPDGAAPEMRAMNMPTNGVQLTHQAQ
jgi:hypothetical protein